MWSRSNSPERRRRLYRAALLLMALSAAPTTAREQPTTPPPPPPRPSGLEERVDVRVAEFKLLATDRQGKPVTDLKPEELVVIEDGQERKLAYFERVVSRAADATWGLETTAPVALHPPGEKAAEVETPAAVVPPPPPVRRVLLGFDVKSSKMVSRERWRLAARQWVEQNMRPEDRVAVVIFRTYPDWVAPLTNDKNLLLAAIDQILDVQGAPDRDRRRDVTRLLDDVRVRCIPDPGRQKDNPTTCALETARPFVQEWFTESAETLSVMSSLVGQAAAIPGAKLAILFSEGVIPDPIEVATAVLQSMIGNSSLRFAEGSFGTQVRDLQREITRIHSSARAAGIVFQVVDTRPPSGAGGEDLENSSVSGRSAFRQDPWAEINNSTRSALIMLASETGGRYFPFRQDLAEHLDAAGRGLEGLYAVGYYRDPTVPMSKLKVKIKRRGVEGITQRMADWAQRGPQPLRPDLDIGQPTPTGRGDNLSLPISVVFGLADLPLRRGAGGRGCQAGLFLQALRPDGTIAAEVFDAVTVFTEKSAEQVTGEKVRETVRLELAPGSYRIRLRLVDERMQKLGDRVVDLTLGMGTVRPGLEPTASTLPAPSTPQ